MRVLSKVTTVPPIFELYATPTPQYELLAADAIIPAHFDLWKIQIQGDSGHRLL